MKSRVSAEKGVSFRCRLFALASRWRSHYPFMLHLLKFLRLCLWFCSSKGAVHSHLPRTMHEEEWGCCTITAIGNRYGG